MEQGNHIAGTDKLWLFLKNNNFIYSMNKLLSVSIAFGLAVFTLSFKRTFIEYSIAYPNAPNLAAYSFTYWLLFIYYGFHGIDELIEMYAVFFKRERGALGLLFEMNKFLGVGIAIYIMWFTRQGIATIEDETYKGLETFVQLQVLLFWACSALSLFLCCFFGVVNSHNKRAAKTSDAYAKSD